MAVLSLISCTSKPTTPLASLANESAPSNPPAGRAKPTKKTVRTRRILKQNPVFQDKQQRQQQPNKPSIILLERAIGAGSFRDADTGEMEQRNTVLDGMLTGGGSKFEGPVEKKLREIGAVFADRTEARFHSSGKTVLIFAFQWILPIWTLSLLVACGVIKLPFSIPFLDALIM